MSMGQTCIEHYKDGIFKVTRTPLNINEAAQAIKAAANDAFSLFEDVFDVDGKPARVAVNDKFRLAAVQITGLRLRTKFLLADGALVPVFKDSAGAVEMACEWTVPADMKLYVAAKTHKDNRLIESYMFAKNGSERGFFRLPLPNTFTDSRLCLGSGFAVPKGTLEGTLKAVLRQILESQWNADLLDSATDRIRGLFRFDPSTFKSLPVTNWTSLCHRVNRTEFETLFPG